jgi:hypothetical protein
MKIGIITAQPSVYRDHLSNMPRTMVTTPMQIIGTNKTRLRTSIGNKTHYYTTFGIFLYVQNHLHVSMLTTVIVTHSDS